MDITPQISVNDCTIRGYGPGYFQIKENKIYEDIIISSEKHAIFSPKELDLFIKNYTPEIVIVGTKMTRELKLNLPRETMSPDAACRTYNILLAEGRNVVAVLYRD